MRRHCGTYSHNSRRMKIVAKYTINKMLQVSNYTRWHHGRALLGWGWRGKVRAVCSVHRYEEALRRLDAHGAGRAIKPGGRQYLVRAVMQ